MPTTCRLADSRVETSTIVDDIISNRFGVSVQDPDLGLKMAFGCGHILNDLCAAAWFSYMIIFFEKVACLSNSLSGALVLIGQVVDAITTPIVGIYCDKSAAKAEPDVRGGTVLGRLPWHMAGSILVLLSFPYLFIEDAQFTLGSQTKWVFLWYAAWVSLFQIGWATTQISHLAMIPDLTGGCPERRTSLNAIRYAATVLSTVAVYSVAWVLLSHSGTDSTDSGSGSDNLSRANHTQFKWLALGIICFGGVLSLLGFHWGMRSNIRHCDHLDQDVTKGVSVGAKCIWLKQPKFYSVALMYMCTRLIVNITQSYLALYLLETLDMPKTAIATAPLVLYASSLVGTSLTGVMHSKLGALVSYVIAVLLAAGAGSGLFLCPDDKTWIVYPCVCVFGVCCAVLMVSCLSMVADLIGDLPGSAFVYGSFSFTDKLSSGGVIMAIQTSSFGLSKAHYYRAVVGGFPVLIALISLVSIGLCWLSPTPSKLDFPEELLKDAEGGYDDEEDDETFGQHTRKSIGATF
eukprot:Hpha_TRINITY_DN14045_c0_g1::TRINITY_DN14045_c0_g1_i1::g.44122::m.44122